MSELVISYAKLCHTYVFYPARMQSARPTIVCPRVATLALVLRCSRTYITPTSLHCAASPTQAPKQSEYTPKYKTPNKPPETPEGCVIVISYIIYCKHAQPARSRVGVEARQSLGQLVGPSLRYSYIFKAALLGQPVESEHHLRSHAVVAPRGFFLHLGEVGFRGTAPVNQRPKPPKRAFEPAPATQ